MESERAPRSGYILRPVSKAGRKLVGGLLRPISLLTLLCSLQVIAGTLSNPTSTQALGYENALEHGRDLRKSGRFVDALESFRKAADLARSAHDIDGEASALLLVSGCQIHLFEYREALATAETVRQLAAEAKDSALAGAAANNKATIYSQLGDEPQASEAAHEATLLLHDSNKGYLVRALLNYGSIESRLGHLQTAIPALSEGVRVAHTSGLPDLEALVEHQLGETLLDSKDLTGAEKAFDEAARLREVVHDQDGLASTRADLAELAYRKGDYAVALRRIDTVIASGRLKVSAVPSYWLPHLRGQILFGLGRKTDALQSFSTAVLAADTWRTDALPGDATSTRTVVALHEVYQDFIELAAGLSIERHDPLLARRAYVVLARSRASSLRDQLLSSFDREMRLPPRYFELLTALSGMQALVTLVSDPKELAANETQLEKTRLELTDLENKLGFVSERSGKRDDKGSSKDTLRSIQSNLGVDQLLLCFSLGQRKSFLWAVTRDRLDLYELPQEDNIAAHAKAYSSAVRAGLLCEEGALLSHELFGSLSPALARKREWLIVADGALLDSVPFSCLPEVRGVDGSSGSLIAKHNIRLVPSPLLLADARPSVPRERFVGVADPIYNLADPRNPSSSRAGGFKLLPSRRTNSPVISLARLVGSEREVKTSSARSGLTTSTILTGPDASIRGLRDALQKPARILHFAVHVVSPEHSAAGSPDEAALALSLSGEKVPELLTKETIATLRVPGSLVVLSGCASQQGKNLPSAGLVGLSRAWLLAGAAAVIVSAWPTPDDSGRFFSTFYSHLQASAASQNLAQQAAAALQETQLDMQHGTGYRNSPSFWAAYSLISKE